MSLEKQKIEIELEKTNNQEEFIEITIKFPKELYNTFKGLCKITKIEPQTKLKKLIQEAINCIDLEQF